MEAVMPNSSVRRWSDEEIAKLKSLAQKCRREVIAAELGRSVGATAVMAHKLKLSLKMPEESRE
jgi:hypothetical protein